MASSFWKTVSTYCHHLAPTAGPLLSSIGDAAAAIDQADRETQELNTTIAYINTLGTGATSRSSD